MREFISTESTNIVKITKCSQLDHSMGLILHLISDKQQSPAVPPSPIYI